MAADFASRHLASLGWESGQGLGREKQGINSAIRPELKRDQAGLGHAADDFGFAWWDHCFNKAAKKITVTTCDKSGEVKVVAQKTTVETKLSERRAPKDLLYGCFVAAKKPEDESRGGHHDDDESRDHSSLSKLTDEEILRRCGGRTAHKGARHGIRQVAKLKRAKEHKLLHAHERSDSESESKDDTLDVSANQSEQEGDATDGSASAVERKEKKSKKRKSEKGESKKSKKGKNPKKVKENPSPEAEGLVEGKSKKSKKSKKQDTAEKKAADVESKKVKKSKKNGADESEGDSAAVDQSKKKKKKSKDAEGQSEKSSKKAKRKSSEKGEKKKSKRARTEK